MKLKRICGFALAVGVMFGSCAAKSASAKPATPSVAAAKAAVPMFDGRNYEAKMAKMVPERADLLREEVRARSKESFLSGRLQGLSGDFDEDYALTDFAEGSFTRSGASQTAYLYRYSYTSGLIVVENDKVVAHFSGDPGDYARYISLRSTPDINGNRRSEIVLMRNVEDTSEIFAYVFDGDGDQLKFLGAAEVFKSNVEPGGDEVAQDMVEETAYAALAEPAASPKFTRETYLRKGAAGWSLSGRPQAFTLDPSSEAALTRIDGEFAKKAGATTESPCTSMKMSTDRAASARRHP